MRCPEIWTPGSIAPLTPSSLATGARWQNGRAMKKIAFEYWEGVLRADPRRATFLGDRRYDSLMEDVSPEAEVRDRERLGALLARVRAISPASLDEKDEVTRSSLELQIRND